MGNTLANIYQNKYEDLISEKICAKLGISNTGVTDFAKKDKSKIAWPYYPTSAT